MKVRNLLFMAALLSVGASASAEVVDGVRQVPIPEKGSLSYTDIMYLYNQGAKKFFCGANAWTTQISAADTGWEVRINKYNIDDAVDMQVSIRNNNVSKGSWKTAFLLADGSGYTDWASGNDTLFTIVPQGNEVYRFQPGSDNTNYTQAAYPDAYWGIPADNTSDTPTAPWNLTTSDNIDWYFVTVDAYKAYSAKITLYTAAKALKTQLDAAVAAGVSESDIASYRAVYTNEESTVEEIEAAVTGVKQAIASYNESNVKADDPVDQTSYITNPDYASNSNTGWSGTAPAFQSYKDAEFYSKTYDYYQKLTGLPNGVYAVTVDAFYRSGYCAATYTEYQAGTNKEYAKLYALCGTDTMTTSIKNAWAGAADEKLGEGSEYDRNGSSEGTEGPFIANNMQAAAKYLATGKYSNKCFFAVSDGTATIGLKKSTTISGDWTLFNNWGLKYYGKGTDAYTLWLDDAMSQAKDYSYLEDGDNYYTESVVEEYNTEKAKYTSASSAEEVVAAVKAVTAKAQAVEENLTLWNEYVQALSDAYSSVINDNKIQGDDKDELSDYYENDAIDIREDHALNNEELTAEIAKVKEMTKKAIDNGITEGTDVTNKYIKNADFEVKNSGWTVVKASGGNVQYGGTGTNTCFEGWNNASFDVYQEVEDAPVGVYSISVQGFYRYGRGDNAYNYYQNGISKDYVDAVKVYVNDNTTSFPQVFDEPKTAGEFYTQTNDIYKGADGNDYPNDMASAAEAFAAGMYTKTSYGIVANKGDKLRVGVKGVTNQLNDSWAIWDNFKMVYEGTNADIVKPFLEDKVSEVSATLTAEGLVIGSDVKATAQTNLADAQNNAAGSDGTAMFESLKALISDAAAISSSKALFDTLQTQTNKLNDYMEAYGSSASQSAMATAVDLSEEANAALAQGTATNAQASELIAKIREAGKALRIPSNYASATEDSPVDFTSVIENPSYDVDGACSAEGWTSEGSIGLSTDDAAHLAEFFHQTFNHNQTLTNLPDGYYELQVSAFQRYGGYAADYQHYLAGDVQDSVYLYAVASADTTKATLPLLSTGGVNSSDYEGVVKVNDSTEVYVPNTMKSASYYFSDGAYVCTLQIYVVGGKLTIGVRKNSLVANDWVIMDDWKLRYLGTETPAGIQGISDAKTANKVSEIYSVGGARLNSLQKGVNILKMQDGTVKKVMVK